MTTFAPREDGSKTSSPPRGVTLRPGASGDEAATFDVMRRSMGFEMHWRHHAAIRAHLRTTATSSFWVAEEMSRFGGVKILGYARSIVRERVWSLTEFFVLPGHHRKGIGSALLDRCLEDGRQTGADTRLVLASQHPSADALYIRKADCFPRLPMLLLAGQVASLRVTEAESASIVDTVHPHIAAGHRAGASGLANPGARRLVAEPVVLTPQTLARLNALDRATVGYARPEEHAHWAAEMGGANGASRLFRAAPGTSDAGEIVGYAHIGAHSSGPILACDPADLPRMIAHSAALAQVLLRPPAAFGQTTTMEQNLAVAGVNEAALRWLLECGWQLVFQYLFMSSRPFGQFDRYVCYNPLYVL